MVWSGCTKEITAEALERELILTLLPQMMEKSTQRTLNFRIWPPVTWAAFLLWRTGPLFAPPRGDEAI
jgi:hypothetical protein